MVGRLFYWGNIGGQGYDIERVGEEGVEDFDKESVSYNSAISGRVSNTRERGNEKNVKKVKRDSETEREIDRKRERHTQGERERGV